MIVLNHVSANNFVIFGGIDFDTMDDRLTTELKLQKKHVTKKRTRLPAVHTVGRLLQTIYRLNKSKGVGSRPFNKMI